MTLAHTVDALLDRVRRDALLASRGPAYTLASDYTSGATTLALNETPTHIGVGTILSVDYELFYVQGANNATKTVTVIPGYYSTTEANHSTGAIVEVDGRFPKAALLDYAEHEIRSWGKQLWRVTARDLEVTRGNRTYDLAGITGDIYFLLDVRLKPVGTTTDFWNFSWTGDGWAHADARLLRDMATGEFASGRAIQLLKAPQKSTTARIAVAQPFDLSALTGSADLVATVGLQERWLNIVELGVRARAMSATVIGRTDWRVGNMSRAAEEVSAFDTMRAVQQAQGARDVAFAEAAAELRAEWPYRGGG